MSDEWKRDSEDQAEEQSQSGNEEAQANTQAAQKDTEGSTDVPYMELFFSEESDGGAESPDGEDLASDEGLEPDGMSVEELNRTIEDMCLSKAQEFRMIGYEHVTGPEIWECVSDKYHKTGTPPLHRIVNDILSLKVTSFMNWMTISMYKKG